MARRAASNRTTGNKDAGAFMVMGGAISYGRSTRRRARTSKSPSTQGRFHRSSSSTWEKCCSCDVQVLAPVVPLAQRIKPALARVGHLPEQLPVDRLARHLRRGPRDDETRLPRPPSPPPSSASRLRAENARSRSVPPPPRTRARICRRGSGARRASSCNRRSCRPGVLRRSGRLAGCRRPPI